MGGKRLRSRFGRMLVEEEEEEKAGEEVSDAVVRLDTSRRWNDERLSISF